MDLVFDLDLAVELEENVLLYETTSSHVSRFHCFYECFAIMA